MHPEIRSRLSLKLAKSKVRPVAQYLLVFLPTQWSNPRQCGIIRIVRTLEILEVLLELGIDLAHGFAKRCKVVRSPRES